MDWIKKNMVVATLCLALGVSLGLAILEEVVAAADHLSNPYSHWDHRHD